MVKRDWSECAFHLSFFFLTGLWWCTMQNKRVKIFWQQDPFLGVIIHLYLLLSLCIHILYRFLSSIWMPNDYKPIITIIIIAVNVK